MPHTVRTILPSKDEEESKAQIVYLLKAAAEAQVVLDPDGFARSWLSDNVRVLVSVDGEQCTGFAVVVFGRRWFDENFTASVLLISGPGRQELLAYIVEMSRMLGAGTLFWEHAERDDIDGVPTGQRMMEL